MLIYRAEHSTWGLGKEASENPVSFCDLALTCSSPRSFFYPFLVLPCSNKFLKAAPQAESSIISSISYGHTPPFSTDINYLVSGHAEKYQYLISGKESNPRNSRGNLVLFGRSVDVCNAFFVFLPLLQRENLGKIF